MFKNSSAMLGVGAREREAAYIRKVNYLAGHI